MSEAKTEAIDQADTILGESGLTTYRAVFSNLAAVLREQIIYNGVLLSNVVGEKLSPEQEKKCRLGIISAEGIAERFAARCKINDDAFLKACGVGMYPLAKNEE